MNQPRLVQLVTHWRERPAAFGVVLANLVPIAGVFFLGWDAFMVVFLYWLENGVIGVLNVLKLMLAGSSFGSETDAVAVEPEDAPVEDSQSANRTARRRPALRSSTSPNALKGCLVPFFVVHYFGFMAGHLLFILVLIGPSSPLKGSWNASFASIFNFGFSAWDWASLVVALISLVAEHGYLFYKEYWLSGEYRRASAPVQMFQPYPRIVVIHIAILFGGFLFVFFSLPDFMVVILVAMKIGLELRAIRKGAKR